MACSKFITNTNPNEIISARGACGTVTGTSAHASAGALVAVAFDGNVSDDQSYFGISWICHSQGPVVIVALWVSTRVVLRTDVAWKIKPS